MAYVRCVVGYLSISGLAPAESKSGYFFFSPVSRQSTELPNSGWWHRTPSPPLCAVPPRQLATAPPVGIVRSIPCSRAQRPAFRVYLAITMPER